MLLHWLFGAAGLLAAGGVYLLCPTLSFWWTLPIAVAAYLVAGLLYILALFVISLFPVKNGGHYGNACYGVVRLTLPWLLSLLGWRVQLTGGEQVPDHPFLLVSNHRSNFDPLVTLLAFLSRKLTFVSKPENFRLPLAGTWMRRAAFLAIDRENPRKAMTAIHQAADNITTHHLCVGLYPEGTRNKASSLLPLLPFHNGSLKIAKLARCPIVTVALRYEKGPLFLRTAHLTVVDVIHQDTVAATRTDGLAVRVQEAIERELAAH